MSCVKQILKTVIFLVALARVFNEGDAVLCLRQCGGEILGSEETVGDCCRPSPMGRGGQDYSLVSNVTCNSCFDFQTIPTNIIIESDPNEPQLGENLSINCVVTTEEEVMIDAEITWFLPNGMIDSIFSISDATSRIEAPLGIFPLEVEDFGTYICFARISSDMYPGVNVFVEETFTYTGTPTTPFRVIMDDTPPTLGSTYRLTCATNSTITMIETIEWLSPDGTLLDSQDVSEGMDGSARELVFDQLSFSDSGRYTCRLNDTISIPVLVTVEAPEVSPVVSGGGEDPFPVLNEQYRIDCNVIIPDLPDSELTVTWISPSGDVLAEEIVTDSTTAAISVLFDSIQPQTAGEEYTCEAILSTSLASQNFFYSSVFNLSPEADRCRGECDTNAQCTEILGTAVCMCNGGFSGNGQTCEEIIEPECRIDGECDPNARCLNNTCVCNEGFSGNGTNCVAITEPECSSNGDCDPNAACVDNVCVCNQGFTGNGMTCAVIIDPECMDDSECDTNASCVDGFCECNPGFSGNGTICMEIVTTPPMECRNDNDCDPNARCLENGNCRCNNGFEGNGQTCRDVNECERNLDNCARVRVYYFILRSANCINTVGGFQCRCFKGLEGDGVTCSDINECDLDPCHRDADCVNKVGTFTCRCRGKDAIGDGINCCISEKTLNRIAKEEERAAGRSKRQDGTPPGRKRMSRDRTKERGSGDESPRTPKTLSKSEERLSGRDRSREIGSGDETPHTPKAPRGRTPGKKSRNEERGSGDESPRTPKTLSKSEERLSGRDRSREISSGDETPHTPKAPRDRTPEKKSRNEERGSGDESSHTLKSGVKQGDRIPGRGKNGDRGSKSKEDDDSGDIEDDQTSHARGRRTPEGSPRGRNANEGESTGRTKRKKKEGKRKRKGHRKGTKGRARGTKGQPNTNGSLRDQYPECEAVIQSFLTFKSLQSAGSLSYSWPW